LRGRLGDATHEKERRRDSDHHDRDPGRLRKRRRNRVREVNDAKSHERKKDIHIAKPVHDRNRKAVRVADRMVPLEVLNPQGIPHATGGHQSQKKRGQVRAICAPN
jgi:hypothetical protein